MSVRKPAPKPDNAVHPGDVINEALWERRLRQRHAAEAMGIAASYLNDIIHGRRAVTAGIALKVERLTGMDALTLVRMQAAYDLAVARERAA